MQAYQSSGLSAGRPHPAAKPEDLECAGPRSLVSAREAPLRTHEYPAPPPRPSAPPLTKTVRATPAPGLVTARGFAEVVSRL